MSTGKGGDLKERESVNTYESRLSISNTPSPRYIKTKRLNMKHKNLVKEEKDCNRKSFAGKISRGEKDYLLQENSLSPITSGNYNTGERARNIEEDSRLKTSSNHSRGARFSNSSYQLEKLIYMKQD